MNFIPIPLLIVDEEYIPTRCGGACNTLMQIEVAILLLPIHHAFLRSAGHVGLSTYEELVAAELVPTCVEATHNGQSQLIPLTLPPVSDTDVMYSLEHATVVIYHTALASHGLTINAFRRRLIGRLRYVCGPSVTGISTADKSDDTQFDPQYASIIELQGCDGVTTLYEPFLFRSRSITSIDLSPLRNVTTIEGYAFASCTSLVTIDLAPLNNVTVLGGGFLAGCQSLTHLDLAPLSNLTVLESGCFTHCTSLTSLDLSPFKNLTRIKESFLYGCSSLKSIDLSPLRKVTMISTSFLADCSSLTSIDLTPLENIDFIPQRFMFGCTTLTTVDITPLGRASTVERDFLGRCPRLKKYALCPDPNVLGPAMKHRWDEWAVHV